MDISPYMNNAALLDQTAGQLIKDFNFSGITITFSGNPVTAYRELFSQVEPHISSMMGKEKFFALLYRIDISEKQLSDALGNEPARAPSAVVTDLILKRELQKVVLRKLSQR